MSISKDYLLKKQDQKNFIDLILKNTTTHFIHPSSFADEGCFIGAGTKIWHFCHIMTGAHIGENCNIGQNVFIATGVIVGNNVKIQNNVSLYSGVICKDDVFLGPSVVFTNIKNPRSAVVRKDQYLKTTIGKGCSIGANATILCGINLGQYALIGAGAVVTKDVAPYALMTGNPATQSGWVSEYGHRLDFDKKGIGICPETGQNYVLVNNIVEKVIS